MKKIVVIILLVAAIKVQAQSPNKLFGRDPIINLENFQKQRLYYGFYLGFNSYDFKIDYKTVGEDIQIKTTTGFNIGLVANLKLQEYVSLRFEPGLNYTTRNLRYPVSYFPAVPAPTPANLIREVNSTYLHFPLLLKFSSLRTGNVRPYLVGGVSATLPIIAPTLWATVKMNQADMQLVAETARASKIDLLK